MTPTPATPVLAILQARVSSSRLPRKALLELGDDEQYVSGQVIRAKA